MRRNKVKTFSQMYPEAVAAIAAELGRSEAITADAIEQYWWSVRFSMENDTMPTIIIGKVGRLRPRIASLEHAIRQLIKTAKGVCGVIRSTSTHLRPRIAKLWAIRKRLEQESRALRYKHLRPPVGQGDALRKLFIELSPPVGMCWWRELTQLRRPKRSHITNPSGAWTGDRPWEKRAKGGVHVRTILDTIGYEYDIEQ